MQDINSFGGGGGRLFGGVGGSNGGDRRLRPHNHTPQAMKCPRCESLNTKFCYYNNYNLSQPRHFCKSCRRYWTKGGVLRNVPVGGGCRKTKRSNSKSNNNSSSSSSSISAVRKSSNSQNSSSDSSSLTATTSTAVNTTTVPVTIPVLNFHETTTGFSNIPNSSFDPQFSSANNSMFPEIGTFTSLITSSTSETPLGFNDISRLTSANQPEWLDTEEAIGEDWNNGTDQEVCDLTGIWNQTQWNDLHQLNYLR